MGQRGPAPTPTHLRLLRGDRASRINAHEPVAPTALPVPPEEIADDVRAIWDFTVRELDAMRLASSADRDALLCLCEAIATHRKASAILARSPVLVKSVQGALIRNPALAVQRDAAHAIRSLAQLFGLTPSGRSAIQVERQADREHVNPFASLG